MAKDIQQPQRQVYSPRQTRIAHVPAQETSASGTTKSQDFGRILGGLGQLAGTYAQEKVQQQREIDTADKHKFIANKAKYLPQLMKEVEENNLQGAPADEVYSFAQKSEAYQNLYGGFQDEDNKKTYQEANDSQLLGQFTQWQTQYEEQERLNLLTGAMTAGIADASPEELSGRIEEFRLDALYEDGLYKMREEEFNTLAVSLASSYNQAGEYDKAEALMSTLKFDDGMAPDANKQLNFAQAKLEEARQKALKNEFESMMYGLHNDPEITEERSRAFVAKYHTAGLLPQGRDQEAVHDFIMSGGKKSKANQLETMISFEGAGQAQTLEGLQNILRRFATANDIPTDVRDQAFEYHVGQKFYTAMTGYLEAQEAAQEFPDDMETQAALEAATEARNEALRFAPAQVQAALVDLASITTDADGNPPENIQELGTQMEMVTEAFRGNLPEALKTYFPDDKITRDRLWQLSLLKDAYGSSWEMGLKKAYESRGDGPEAQHPTWDDKDTVSELRAEAFRQYGPGAIREYDQLMRLGKMAKLDTAHTHAMAVLESNQTTILDRDKGNRALQAVYPGDARTVSDHYRLKGPQGRAFAQQFSARVDEEFGGRGVVDGVLDLGTAIDGSNYQYDIIREYIADVIPGLRETTGLDLENIPADEAFDADYPVVVEALAPHALHLSIPGIASLGVVTIDTLIEYQKAREARSVEVESQPEGEAERPWPQGKQRSIREQFEYRKTL